MAKEIMKMITVDDTLREQINKAGFTMASATEKAHLSHPLSCVIPQGRMDKVDFEKLQKALKPYVAMQKTTMVPVDYHLKDQIKANGLSQEDIENALGLSKYYIHTSVRYGKMSKLIFNRIQNFIAKNKQKKSEPEEICATNCPDKQVTLDNIFIARIFQSPYSVSGLSRYLNHSDSYIILCIRAGRMDKKEYDTLNRMLIATERSSVSDTSETARESVSDLKSVAVSGNMSAEISALTEHLHCLSKQNEQLSQQVEKLQNLVESMKKAEADKKTVKRSKAIHHQHSHRSSTSAFLEILNLL